MLRGLLGGFARGRRQTSAATLVLDFLAGLNDSRITYSGGANGTRVNSSGNIVAATTPRFDYDPVTLAAKGLLVEEARTNVCLRSGDLSNAAWSTFGALTITSGAADPAGGTSGATIDDTDSGAFSGGIFQNFTVANDSATNVNTIFLKQGTAAASALRLNYVGGTGLAYEASIDWATKTVTARASAVAADVSITPWYNGYYRISVRGANNSTGNTTLQIVLYPAGTLSSSATGSVIAWGGQTELGSFPTSYIPTTTATVPRTADSAVMTGTNFSSWYNQSEGTFVVSAIAPNVPASTFPRFVEANDQTADNRISLLTNSSNVARFAVSVGAVAQVDMGATVWTAGTVGKMAVSYKANDFALSYAGGALDTDTSGTVPTVTQLEIGQVYGATQINTHIRSITYYPSRLSNEQLQALTA